MNFIKNGNFESGQLDPWIVDLGNPDEFVLSNTAVLMPLGSKIMQILDLEEIGNLTSFAFKVKARASQAPLNDTLKTRSRFQLSFYYQYANQIRFERFDLAASGGFQDFQVNFTIDLPEPLIYARAECWVPQHSGPTYDPRDIWFSGFELSPYAQIP